MPELPPYVPEFDLAFMSQMLGGGAVRSEPEDPATGVTSVRSVFISLFCRSLRSPPHARPSGHGQYPASQ